ncbi:MAG: SGNH/GDSL hydrolase family protein [Chitinophagaceae bacterium]|nr:MAG: SGNH/GDSL hydrolase family protein [Chitinophagaceae bacterium]
MATKTVADVMTMVKEKTPGLKFVNQGHNGWTSGGIAEKIEELGISTADVYTIFLGTNDWWQGRPIGTLNDYKNNTGNSTISGSFRIITNKLKSLNPSAKIILITPLQRSDFVYISNYKNNAFGSYKEKNDQSLKDVAAAIAAIANFEKFKLVDLYNKSGITQQNMINFKRLRDPSTGAYKDYRYPAFIDVPFDPEKDDYPYPAGAVNMTYDGLHPSDKGYAVIAKMVMQAMN